MKNERPVILTDKTFPFGLSQEWEQLSTVKDVSGEALDSFNRFLHDVRHPEPNVSGLVELVKAIPMTKPMEQYLFDTLYQNHKTAGEVDRSAIEAVTAALYQKQFGEEIARYASQKLTLRAGDAHLVQDVKDAAIAKGVHNVLNSNRTLRIGTSNDITHVAHKFIGRMDMLARQQKKPEAEDTTSIALLERLGAIRANPFTKAIPPRPVELQPVPAVPIGSMQNPLPTDDEAMLRQAQKRALERADAPPGFTRISPSSRAKEVRIIAKPDLVKAKSLLPGDDAMLHEAQARVTQGKGNIVKMPSLPSTRIGAIEHKWTPAEQGELLQRTGLGKDWGEVAQARRAQEYAARVAAARDAAGMKDDSRSFGSILGGLAKAIGIKGKTFVETTRVLPDTSIHRK